MMSRWRYHDISAIPAVIALRKKEQPVGLATYYAFQDDCELVTLNSFVEGEGIGEALLYAVRDAGIAAGCKRLWLTTSNDNLPALQFYQKRGMAIVAIHRYAIDEARKLNTQIPVLCLISVQFKESRWVGGMNLSNILQKPYSDLSDFEETLLRGVHWLSNSHSQLELETKFTCLVTCLETYFTPRGGDQIANAIAEGTSFLIFDSKNERIALKGLVKKLYGKRSAISHGGRQAVLQRRR